MTAIDTHAHLLMPSLQQELTERAAAQMDDAAALELKRNGPDSIKASGQMIRDRWLLLTDLSKRLEHMASTGITHQWVSPSPSHFYPWADQELATWIYQQAHQILADHIADEPEQLSGLGMVPLQHPELCVAALDDAVIHHGFLGVEVSSFAQEIELSDERLEPFWARAAELGAIIFLHPFGCSLDERLDRYYLANTVGQPTENAVAISHMIFSGVFDRHPDLQVVAAHGGGYLTAGIGRADRAWMVRPESSNCAHPPSHYLSKLHYDTVLHSDIALKQLIELVGADRVVLGSDYPFDMGLDEPVKEIEQGLQDMNFGSETVQQVLFRNATALQQRRQLASKGAMK